MKFCRSCQQYRDKSAFARNRAKPDGLQVHCRECKKKGDHAYYKSHTVEQLERVRIRQREIAEDNARRVYEYLLTYPCVDCHESDPLVLEFDHVRGEKVASISFMIERKFS